MDSHDFNMLRQNQLLTQQVETMRAEICSLQAAASANAVKETKTAVVSERRRLQIRAMSARLKRQAAKKSNKQIPNCFTKVKPEQLAGAALEERADDSQAMSTDSLAAAFQPKRGKGEPRIADRKWHFTKMAMDQVMVKMPGAFQRRGASQPGIMANPTRLASKVTLWMRHGHISINAVANILGDELESVADELYVAARRRNGSAVRTLPGNKDKPLDVAGRYHSRTVTEAIHAFGMALDGEAAPKLLAADALHVCVDISTFGTYHMQSMIMFASRVVEQGLDAAGNLLLCVKSAMSRLPSIPVADKIVRKFVGEGGEVMATSTARAASTSLILAGLPAFASHPCTSWGVDGGGEATGAQAEDASPVSDQRTTHTSNKNGIGSYRNMVNVTREGFRQAMDKNGDVLTRVMDLHGVPEEAREVLRERPTPKTLTPVQTYSTVPRELVTRERSEGYVKGYPAWTGKCTKESLPPRPSMRQDPLTSMAMVKGGVALVFDCTKHLAHTVAQHSYKPMLPFIRDLASVILALSNVWIHERLATWLGKIFALRDCGPITSLQKNIAEGIQQQNQPLYGQVQNHFMSIRKVTKLTEPCSTRWGAISKGALGLAQRLPAVAVVIPVALAEGTDESRLNAAVSMWSKNGFRHGGKLRFSAKLGRLCFRAADPGFLFGTHLTAFFEKSCHGIILEATSHHKEMCAHSIGGVGSVLRRVLYFLTRLMWVVMPLPKDLCNATWEDVKKAIKSKDRKRMKCMIYTLTAPGALLKRKPGRSTKGGAWEMHFPLQHRGTVTGTPNTGLLMLNPNVGVARADGHESPLEHCYGPFYRADMANMVPELIEVIMKLSEMQFDEERNFLPKGFIRTQCAGPQKYPFERRQAMVKAVFVMTRHTIQALVSKFSLVLYDPLLFLACAAKTETMKVLNSSGEESLYHVASDEALANAALFLVQLQEIEQGYAPQLSEGEQLGDFMHGALREFCLNKALRAQLDEFRKARNVILSPGCTEIGYTHPGRANFRPTPQKTYGNLRMHTRPQPMTAFRDLAIVAFKAAGQPRTQNMIEGGFSIASGEFRAGKRNTRPEMWSAIIRKKNVFDLQMEATVRKAAFARQLARCLTFRRANKKGIKNIYNPDTGESEEKQQARMRKDLPQYAKEGGSFPKTNISDAVESRNVLKAPDRNGGATQNRRQRGFPDDLYDEPERENQKQSANKKDLRLPKSQDVAEEPERGNRENPATGNTRRLRIRPAIELPSAKKSANKSGDECEMEMGPASDDAPMADSGHDAASDAEDWTDAQPAPEPDSSLTKPGESKEPEADASKADRDGMCPNKDSNAEQGGSDGGQGNQISDDDSTWLALCAAAGLDVFEELDNQDAEVLKDSENAQRKLEKCLKEGGDESSDSEEEAAQPFIEDKFPEVQSRKVGKFKREYAEALSQSKSWKPCVIMETKETRAARDSLKNDKLISKVVLRRSDDVEITVRPSRMLFYILRTLCGPQLIRVERIFIPENSTNIMVEHSRVLPSSEARLATDRKEDLTETLFRQSGQPVLSRRIGSDNIDRQVAARRKANKNTELYHWGDRPWEARAVDLVGAVFWIPVGEEDNTTASLLKQTLVAIQNDFSPGIRNLKKMDCVVVGDPFTEA